MQPLPNPVLTGFHPDPSVCRVGDEYFLVTSSFAWFPGLPVHRSVDLLTWEPVGHVLAEPSHIELDGLDVSDGVWAATIRHSAGLFYVVYCVARERRDAGTFVTTASSAAGPWSTPVELEAEGIDPSLFFDDDGRCWFTATRNSRSDSATGPGEIWMREFDPVGLKLIGPTHVLWHGTVAGTWVEAPHLVKREGTYHLIAAEGGTERNHAVTAARASHVIGPYKTDPRSPLLTHRHLGESAPVQNVGHADLVDTPDGRTYAVLLAVRSVDGAHTLGREVFVVPVEWEDAGPVFAPPAGIVELAPAGERGEPTEPQWISLRGPVDARFAGPDVILPTRSDPLAHRGRPSFVGRKQDRHHLRFEATAPSSPAGSQTVAVVAFQNQDRFAAAQLVSTDTGVQAQLVLRMGGEERLLARAACDAEVTLRILSSPRLYTLEAVHGGTVVAAASVPARLLSTEDAGGFVGVVVGLLNQGPEGVPSYRFSDVTYSSLTSESVAHREPADAAIR